MDDIEQDCLGVAVSGLLRANTALINAAESAHAAMLADLRQAPGRQPTGLLARKAGAVVRPHRGGLNMSQISTAFSVTTTAPIPMQLSAALDGRRATGSRATAASRAGDERDSADGVPVEFSPASASLPNSPNQYDADAPDISDMVGPDDDDSMDISGHEQPPSRSRRDSITAEDAAAIAAALAE